MSGSVNKVILIGRLGKNPELRYTSGGASVANFSIATSQTWMKDGERQQKTEWHKIVVWGKLAEICAQNLSKGSSVFVEGSIHHRQYQDKDGRTVYSTEIQAHTIQFLSSKGKSDSSPGVDGHEGANDNESDLNDPLPNDEDLPF